MSGWLFGIIKKEPKNLKLVSAIFHYFEKINVFLHFFERSTLKRNLTYSSFFFPQFHEHLFSPRLPCATRLLETSWLEKITMCNWDNACDVAACDGPAAIEFNTFCWNFVHVFCLVMSTKGYVVFFYFV